MKKQAEELLGTLKKQKFPNKAIKKAGESISVLSDKTKKIAVVSQEKVLSTMDQNNDGKVDIDDIIVLGLRLPGVRINRKDFLQKELFKYYPQEKIDIALEHTPAYAQLDKKIIDNIADEVIKVERNFVSGISAALGAPGGFAMAATLPADIIQYYGYMLRAAQKLLYLYGFPQIDFEEDGQKFDSETINLLILSLGVMYGVAGAKNALLAISKALATGVEKKLVNAALTKGTIYPIIKNVMSWFNVKLTKKVFAGFFKKSIPIAGGVIGGTITFLSFKPCCDKLKTSLQDTYLSNPHHHSTHKEDEFVRIIEKAEIE